MGLLVQKHTSQQWRCCFGGEVFDKQSICLLRLHLMSSLLSLALRVAVLVVHGLMLLVLIQDKLVLATDDVFKDLRNVAVDHCVEFATDTFMFCCHG